MRNLISGIGAMTTGLLLTPEIGTVVFLMGVASITCWTRGIR